MNHPSFVLGLLYYVFSHFRVTVLCPKLSRAVMDKSKNTPSPCVEASSARTGRVHLARLATQGANSIKLKYS